MSVKTWETFDITKVVYKDPVKNALGGMNAYIDTSPSDSSNPKFQLPRSRIPFGLDKNEKSESTRYNLELSLDNPEFVKWVRNFDDQTMKHASGRSKTWFGKEIDQSIMKQMEIFRLSAQQKDEKYNPLMRVKVASVGPKVPKVFVQTLENGKKKYEPGTLQDIEKGSYVTPIIDIQGIWMISKKGFGVTYLVTHILVEKPNADVNEFPFVGVEMDTDNPFEEGATEPPSKRQKKETDDQIE